LKKFQARKEDRRREKLNGETALENLTQILEKNCSEKRLECDELMRSLHMELVVRT